MTYIFGVFEFDAAALELRKSGRAVALEPQPARALGLLLERAGEAVSREELSAHVWGPGTHVDFNRGLAYCIGQIRAALGDSGGDSRFIQTLPRRGFRFVAPVRGGSPVGPLTDVTTRATEHRASVRYSVSIAIGLAAMLLLVFVLQPFVERAMQRWRRPVVAVSIFDNETGDRRYDRAVHALSDAVVDRLTTLGPDRVGIVGNASILRMPRSRRDLEEIRQQTGASHVILAQLLPSKGNLSLLMQVIRLDDGTHVWSRRVGRRVEDSLEGLDEEAARLIETGVRQHVLSIPHP
jgi:DNA-binding winged helix-turn-helix (wHTH) protein/TolB-like protein